jgi:hypothetical protein
MSGKVLISIKSVLASVLTTALAITLTSCGSGNNAFTVSKEGMVLVTAMYDKDGDKSGEMRTTVRSVAKSGRDMAITSVTQIVDGNGNVTNTVEEVVNVVNGDAEFDIGSSLATVTGLAVSSADKMRVPSKMNVGDVFGDLRIDLGLVKVSITNRQLDAIESITVPAGTFKDAYKMAYKMTAGGNTSAVTEWYARGVGIVKSVSVDGDGNTESSAELVSMSQGGGKSAADVPSKDAGAASRDSDQDVAETSVSPAAESDKQAAGSNERLVSDYWVADDSFYYSFSSNGNFVDGTGCDSGNIGTYEISGSTLIFKIPEEGTFKYGFKLSDDGKILTVNFNDGATAFKRSQDHPCPY